MDVTQVLLAALSSDLNVRNQAEQQIQQAESSNMVRGARHARRVPLSAPLAARPGPRPAPLCGSRFSCKCSARSWATRART